MNRSFCSLGFTLIEIMVVISIIGILASVLYVNFGDARNSSQNRALMAEVKEVQLALELYKAQNGEYPGVPGCGNSSGLIHDADTLAGNCDTNDYIAGLVPNFISELPQASDSPNFDNNLVSGCHFEYVTNAAGSFYKLTGIRCLGAGTTLTQSNEMARCPSSCPSVTPCVTSDAAFSSSFAIYSLGGECQ